MSQQYAEIIDDVFIPGDPANDPSNPELGWGLSSLNPVKHIKKAVSAAKKVAKKTGVTKIAKAAYKVAKKAGAARAAKGLLKAAKKYGPYAIASINPALAVAAKAAMPLAMGVAKGVPGALAKVNTLKKQFAQGIPGASEALQIYATAKGMAKHQAGMKILSKAKTDPTARTQVYKLKAAYSKNPHSKEGKAYAELKDIAKNVRRTEQLKAMDLNPLIDELATEV